MDIANQSVKTLEGMRGTKLPESVHEAIEGNFLAAGGGVLETALGRTPGGEMKEWNKRVMSLQKANEILRDYEDGLVKRFILSPASALRLALDGFLFIPKWLVTHTPEITLILWPIIKKGGEQIGTMASIVMEVEKLERELAAQKEEMSRLYSLTPRDKSMPAWKIREKIAAGGKVPLSASEIRSRIIAAEKEIARIEKEIDDEADRLIEADKWLEMAIAGACALLIFFSAEKLLTLAHNIKDALKVLSPARDLRDELLEKIKASAFPQARVHRKVVKKRSRRN